MTMAPDLAEPRRFGHRLRAKQRPARIIRPRAKRAITADPDLDTIVVQMCEATGDTYSGIYEDALRIYLLGQWSDGQRVHAARSLDQVQRETALLLERARATGLGG